ncbi:hypothetical protein BJ973_009050 [Actinoplanes tereljensis]
MGVSASSSLAANAGSAIGAAAAGPLTGLTVR